MNIKKILSDCITYKIDGADYENLIIESISADKGDYSLPCFSFAKVLHTSPMEIANKISESVSGDIVDKCEVVGGYVNFFLNKAKFASMLLENFGSKDLKISFGEGKTAIVDYCSPNLAKFLHIGHLKSLIEGESLCRILEQCGYVVKRLNFIGDYGTPFGKIIGGLIKWGSLDDVQARGNDALQEYYVKFNQAEVEDETLTQYARDLFKKIEDKDPEIYPMYEFIIDIAMKDAKKMFDILGVQFDDYRGENYYKQFTDDTLKLLNNKNLLSDSQGAKIVDLSEYDMPPALFIKSDGTTLYATRDLSASLGRFKDYRFDKAFYVTGVEQVLHFKQWFKVVDMLGLEYADRLEHLPYGRFSLPDGKISSRRGRQAVLVDFIEHITNKSTEAIKDRQFSIEKPEDVVKKVARAVLNYSVLKVERAKDGIFDVEKAFAFDGETAPYMLYTYTRIESVLRKYENSDVEADYSCLNEDAFEVAKLINNFKNVIELAFNKRDASIVAKSVMELCKAFNKMYTTCKIIDGNDASTKAKINLIKALKETLKVGFNIICIDPLQEM
ncbi:MAG: arginine--tRNA ligase [Clostridia bacterium]|nr:arginine--tRNA ligase [Clostridia bacterium]